MSLINQMLQDLDQRQAGELQRALPNEVRSLPPSRRSSILPWVIAGGSIALTTAAIYFYLPGATQSGAAPVAAAVVSPPRIPTDEPPATPAAGGGAPIEAPVPAPAAAEPMPLRLSDVLSMPQPRQSSVPQESRSAPLAKESPAVAPVPVTVPQAVPAKAASGVAASVASKGETRDGPVHIEKTPLQPTPQERAESEYRRGAALLAQGQLKSGMDALRSCLKVDGTHAAARQLLLKALLEQRSYDEARELLSEAVQLQPGRYQWAMTLARLQIEKGDAAGAWQSLQASMGAGANNADYQGLAGNVLQRLGNGKDAAEHYRAALRLSPNDGRWWIGLGLALESQGNGAEARTAFQTARASGSLTSEMAAFVEQRLR
ncbi:MAG: tetratricopeptide repeat protein [Pseudomonadota bacterium]